MSLSTRRQLKRTLVGFLCAASVLTLGGGGGSGGSGGSGGMPVAAFNLTGGSGDLADVNGDGIINGADLGALLAAWGTVARFHGADLNQDQSVGGAYLAMLLSAW